MVLKIKKLQKVLVAGGLFSSVTCLPAFAEDDHHMHPGGVGEAKVKVSGLIETEVGFSSADVNGNTEKTSDTVLATIELAVDAELSDNVRGHILFLHEEDATPLEIDEGTITLGKDAGWSYTMGRMYVPFGAFETNMVSDPLTLDMGETRESAIDLLSHWRIFFSAIAAAIFPDLSICLMEI